jgi:Ca2+-binding EF-hand superfamily protein
MLTELQRRKLTRMYQQTDFNKDGFVETSDYEQIGARVAQFLGLEPGSPESEVIRNRYLGMWSNLKQLADKDGDDKVNEAEYVGGLGALLSQEDYFEPWIRSTVNDILEWEDQDRDGKISQQEYVGFMQIYDIASGDAEDAFRRLDRDGDGYLTREELMQNTEEFFLADDPNAPGNWLMGPY